MTVRFAYLAYPIDQRVRSASSVADYELIEQIKSSLIPTFDCGIIYDPGDAFSVNPGAQVGREIKHINDVALNKADLVIACLPDNQASVGVPMELEAATRLNAVTVVLSNNRQSWSLGKHQVHPFSWEGWLDACVYIHQEHARIGQLTGRDANLKFAGEGQLPTRAYHDDAGFDLYASEDIKIPAGSSVDVPFGVSAQFPPYIWGWIVGRSSTMRNRGLLVNQGIIDTGYTGPLFATVFNLWPTANYIRKGERIAQLIPMSNLARSIDAVRVDELTPGSRGSAGFGSSGL